MSNITNHQSYSSLAIKRSIRDLEDQIGNLLSSSFEYFESNHKRLIALISDNEILRKLFTPYLDMEIDISEILKIEFSGRPSIRIPLDDDVYIGFCLYILSNNGIIMPEGNKVSLENLIYQLNQGARDIRLDAFNNQILRPCFRLIVNRLKDFQEDTVESSNEIAYEDITIINYGNIAIGNQNTQIQNDLDLLETMIDSFLDKGMEQTLIERLKPEMIELIAENKKPTIDESRTKQILGSIARDGKSIALSVIANILTNPSILKVLQSLME